VIVMAVRDERHVHKPREAVALRGRPVEAAAVEIALLRLAAILNRPLCKLDGDGAGRGLQDVSLKGKIELQEGTE
jgi:hypothetical protein